MSCGLNKARQQEEEETSGVVRIGIAASTQRLGRTLAPLSRLDDGFTPSLFSPCPLRLSMCGLSLFVFCFCFPPIFFFFFFFCSCSYSYPCPGGFMFFVKKKKMGGKQKQKTKRERPHIDKRRGQGENSEGVKPSSKRERGASVRPRRCVLAAIPIRTTPLVSSQSTQLDNYSKNNVALNLRGGGLQSRRCNLDYGCRRTTHSGSVGGRFRNARVNCQEDKVRLEISKFVLR